VAEANNGIFDLLMTALSDRVSRYNKRHPQDFGFPNAVWINKGPFQSTAHTCKIQKNTEPKASISLDFPFNSGDLKVEFSSNAGNETGAIIIDIRNNVPSFYFGARTFSADNLADFLLKPVLDPWLSLEINAIDRLSQAERANDVLEQSNSSTAASELREANADLSRRPPDLTGAVQHSLVALECVAREHCHDNATFGKLLERNSNLFPKPLDKGIEKIWGFASEMGRHLREGRTPEEEEAELLVGLATACCTYLARKVKTRDD
jgi:hypothetical protein